MKDDGCHDVAPDDDDNYLDDEECGLVHHRKRSRKRMSIGVTWFLCILIVLIIALVFLLFVKHKYSGFQDFGNHFLGSIESDVNTHDSNDSRPTTVYKGSKSSIDNKDGNASLNRFHQKQHYDPLSYDHWNTNPFDLYPKTHDDSENNIITSVPNLPPQWLSLLQKSQQQQSGNDSYQTTSSGYCMQPNIVNNNLVFVSEGDMYLTNIQNFDSDADADDATKMNIIPSIKLTTTAGNIRTPMIHPKNANIIVFTATYTARRDIYLLDLISMKTFRLTYWEGPHGLRDIIGWKEQDNTDNDDGEGKQQNIKLIFSSTSIASASLPDTRLYEITLATPSKIVSSSSTTTTPKLITTTTDNNHIMQIDSVPLSQATEAVWYNSCYYFTRVTQSSNTQRYTGGTVQQLWKWCTNIESQSKESQLNTEEAMPITTNYNGTSKSPQIYEFHDENSKRYTALLFLSDRSKERKGSSWIPTTMNLWALILSTEAEDSRDNDHDYYVQLTSVSCHNNGLPVQEYSLDLTTKNIVLRIGADLHLLKSSETKSKIINYSNGNGNHNDNSRLLFNKDGNHGKQSKESTDTKKKNNSKKNKRNSNISINDHAANDNNITSETMHTQKGVEKTSSANTRNSNATSKTNNDGNNSQSNGKKINHENQSAAEPKSKFANMIQQLPITPYSDFHEVTQERLIPLSIQDHYTHGDVYETEFNTINMILTLRGQTWVVPVTDDYDIELDPNDDNDNEDIYNNIYNPPPQLYYQSGGMNIPSRKYRVVPGSQMAGAIRVLVTRYLPYESKKNSCGNKENENNETDSSCSNNNDDRKNKRYAIILATDPLSPTGELAFYMIEVQNDAKLRFVNYRNMPRPLIGGHQWLLANNNTASKDNISGLGLGSTYNGGLGSIVAESVQISPCGRRLVWADTDGRICIMPIPLYNKGTHMVDTRNNSQSIIPSYTVLPSKNANNEPMVGKYAEIAFSPGGRYLAITHNSQNQYSVISIVDCGDPTNDYNNNKEESIASNRSNIIKIRKAIQVTPNRFNSFSPYWGNSPYDLYYQAHQNDIDDRDTDLENEDESDNATATEPKTTKPPTFTTVYFLSDRDINTDVSSPWGNRAPSPHFSSTSRVYALPLIDIESYYYDSSTDIDDVNNIHTSATKQKGGRFAGGGAAELFVKNDVDESEENDGKRKNRARRLDNYPNHDRSMRATNKNAKSKRRRVEQLDDELFPKDSDINLVEDSEITKENSNGDGDNYFVRSRGTYRMVHIPGADYQSILSQTIDDGSFVLIEKKWDIGRRSAKYRSKKFSIQIFTPDSYPSDKMEHINVPTTSKIIDFGLSTTRDYFFIVFSSNDIKVIENSLYGLSSLKADSTELIKNIAQTDNIALSTWPILEYYQIYNDAWRMQRDYYYDPEMTNIDWIKIHERYIPLVQRCHKREELDDVLKQMSSELCALHVFVIGDGELYGEPYKYDPESRSLQTPGSLGVEMKRSYEWKGYIITSMSVSDPDYDILNGGGTYIYSPLHHNTLQHSRQQGLEVGDVILAINGESVMNNNYIMDIHSMLRGKSGQSIRLDVLRLQSSSSASTSSTRSNSTNAASKGTEIMTEPVITVPISPLAAKELRYSSWEYKTRRYAQLLAKNAGFALGYIHLRAMGKADENQFAREFFANYNKEALIVDVRHNNGGNIDSWILDMLQRKAFYYWQGRAYNISTGGLGWDEHYAFRGHLIVLVDEKTSSDGEGFARGVMELNLGKVMGKRTWGGGIWFSKDNYLVDGSIVTAPNTGAYNKKYGWGMGIEQQGVVPDIIVDNNPHTAFDDTKDTQLEYAIDEMKEWLRKQPIEKFPKAPEHKPDMSLADDEENCDTEL